MGLQLLFKLARTESAVNYIGWANSAVPLHVGVLWVFFTYIAFTVLQCGTEFKAAAEKKCLMVLWLLNFVKPALSQVCTVALEHRKRNGFLCG